MEREHDPCHLPRRGPLRQPSSGPLRLGHVRPLGDLVGRQVRGGLQPAGEVEERGQGSDLPDLALVPAGSAEGLEVVAVDEARALRQLAGVAEQGPRPVVEVVLRPGRGELEIEVLIPREAADRRRVETQSGASADPPVDHRGQHLALEPAERRGGAEMEALVERTDRTREGEVDRQDPEDAGNDASVLAANPAEEEPAQTSGPLRPAVSRWVIDAPFLQIS